MWKSTRSLNPPLRRFQLSCRRVRALVRAFASLDAVNLVDLFDHRARVTRSVPHVLKGAFRMALRVAFQEIFDGTEANSEARVVRGWKLFLLLPRMLLFRPHRGGVVPRKKLEPRIRQFHEGEWLSLLRDSAHISCETSPPRLSRGRCESGTRFVSRADGRALFCPTSPGRGTPRARERGPPIPRRT